MTKLSDIGADAPVKVLEVGDPGAGKTTSLVSIVKGRLPVVPPQRLFIANFDGDAHMAPLRMFLTPEEQARVYIKTFKDHLGLKGGRVMPLTPPTAFANGMKALEGWMEGEENLGSIWSWGPDTTVVLDSLTSMGRAAMWYRLFVNGKLSGDKRKRKSFRDWGEAMELQENFLDMLTSEAIRCNVVVLTHLTQVGDGPGDDDDDDEEDGKPKIDTGMGKPMLDQKRYPSALGKKLPPKVGGMFSTLIEARTVGVGKNTRHILRTVPEVDVDIKVPALGLPTEIDMKDGLVRIFEAVKLGKVPA